MRVERNARSYYQGRVARVAAVAVLAIALATGAAGCGSTSSNASSGAAGGAAQSLPIAFANFEESSAIFHVLHTQLQAQLAAHPKGGVSVTWYNNNDDPSTMLSNAQLIAIKRPKFVIEYPVTTDDARVGQIFHNASVPCIALNLPVPGCPFLNFEPAQLGTETADVVGPIAKAKGWNASNTTVLLGDNATAGPGVNDVVTYFYPELAKYLGFPRVSPSAIKPTTTTIGQNGVQFNGNSSQETTFTAVQALLTRIPASRHLIIYNINDSMSLGAYTALKDAGRLKNALVAGIGGGVATELQLLQSSPEWVAEGSFFSPLWGEYAIAMGQAMLKGAKPPSLTPLPQTVITKSNIKAYYNLPQLAHGNVVFKKVPPLVANNRYLAKGGFLQTIGNVPGL